MKIPTLAVLTFTVVSLTAQQAAIREIETLIAAKIADDLIVERVKRSGKPPEMSTEDLIALKKAGASDGLIRQLLTVGTSAPIAVTNNAPASGQREIGVYYKRGDEWTELLAEVVNFKSGGALKNIGTAGILKKDLNGFLNGQHSRNSVKTPLEFLVVAPEGIGVTEYQLLRLRENRTKREFRSVTGGVMNAESGAMRDMVPFEGKKVAARQFEIVLPANIGAGEYGFLPPGGASGGGGVVGMPTGAQGKMYTFRIIE